jgi:predicted acylesterase/phospholipase RssA/CRP-like cAMP-binding protein
MDTHLVDDEGIDGLLRASAVFGHLDADALVLVRDALVPRVVHNGEILMRQGDAADGLYLVGSGRLQVIIEREDGGTEVISEIGRGDLVGEMALLTDSPRSATIAAVRDSHLLFLPSDGFAHVVQSYPEALRTISSVLISKLMHTIHHGSTTTPATSIVIVPLDESSPVRELGDRLASSLRPLLGPVPVVRSDDRPAELGLASELRRAAWREQLETANGAVIYLAAPTFDPWTDECIANSDLVVLAAAADGPPGTRAIEDELERRQGSAARRSELVLLHAPGTHTPRGTRRWLGARRVNRHHHVRIDRAGDYDRVARLLVGRGVGVVFSGGGARGIAHVGVLRALIEHGVTIDATAGASIGSIVAGAVARGDQPDEVAAQIRAAVVDRSPVDITFPSVSFAAGGRVTHHIKEGARGLDLEDTWLNFLCVSTNLTRGALEIHQHGPAWTAVRSSFSVPGLFPPMRNEAGDVLVDGGILDNMPVAPLRAAHSGITVIAVDVGARRDFTSGTLPDSGVVSGWRFLANNLRKQSLENLTTLPRILMRLTELGSLGNDDHGECYIRPSLTGVSLLDFNKFDQLIEMGQRDAAPVLDAWLAPSAPSHLPSPPPPLTAK